MCLKSDGSYHLPVEGNVLDQPYKTLEVFKFLQTVAAKIRTGK